MRLKPIDAKEPVSLRDRDARPPKGAPSGDALRSAIDEETDRISDLQQVFYADGRYALLIVLQGRDASGKDGAIGKINDFERMLVANAVVIVKFLLHVSRAEQKKRLEKRLADPTKNWKFRAGDLDDRAKWTAYTAAYSDLLTECSTDWAPWYLVPADDKKVRNWLIARTLADRLERLDLRYPRASAAVRALEIK